MENNKKFGTISAIIRENGNLLEQFLNETSKVELLRVYPYESHCGDTIFSMERSCIERNATDQDLKVLEVIDMIRKTARTKNWDDNKIVIETFVGTWHVFLGFWDNIITLGFSVKPHYRYNPKFETDQWGGLKWIKVR